MSHTPILGGSIASGFEAQFGAATISSLSMSATLIEQLSNDGSDTTISHGSGAFWRHGGKIYLLSARHVLSGRSPFDNSLLSSNCYIPRRIAAYPAIEIMPDRWMRQKVFIDIPEDGGWIQDPDFEVLRTDIAAIPLGIEIPQRIQCLNDHGNIFEEIFTHVGMDCAVVGYPTNSFGGLMTPIWRRGTIASEPLLPVDSKPMFLLDASTSPGFSGSPVFRRHYGALPQLQPDGSINILADRVMTTSFVGIYAGRLQHPHFGGEVPFVFYGNRVPVIFAQLD